MIVVGMSGVDIDLVVGILNQSIWICYNGNIELCF